MRTTDSVVRTADRGKCCNRQISAYNQESSAYSGQSTDKVVHTTDRVLCTTDRVNICNWPVSSAYHRHSFVYNWQSTIFATDRSVVRTTDTVLCTTDRVNSTTDRVVRTTDSVNILTDRMKIYNGLFVAPYSLQPTKWWVQLTEKMFIPQYLYECRKSRGDLLKRNSKWYQIKEGKFNEKDNEMVQLTKKILKHTARHIIMTNSLTCIIAHLIN